MGSRRRETELLAIHQRRQRYDYDRIWFFRRVHFLRDLQPTYLDRTVERLIDPQQKPREAECRLLATSRHGQGWSNSSQAHPNYTP